MPPWHRENQGILEDIMTTAGVLFQNIEDPEDLVENIEHPDDPMDIL